MATNYERGRRLEYRCLDKLRDDGYWATRTPGSKSVADIIALKQGQTLMVQCKRGTGQMLEAAAWNKLVWTAGEYGAVAVYAEAAPNGPIVWWLLTGPRKPRQRADLPREPFTLDYAEAT